MTGLGCSKFVEIGPGKVLSGLVKRITKEVSTANVEDLATLKLLAA
jgi:[acyl-carrier-protein] S-malonyltransferase